MNEHTSGPWKVYYYRPKDNSVSVYSTSTCKIAKVYPKGQIGGQLLRDAEANARLIAAAPELLEACEAAQQLIERFSHVYEYDAAAMPKAIKTLDKVNNAIAAAKGEQP